jgi:NAD(P)-dependent dehydrogenase (short-subunit alcohol dehydrogenase family)
VNGISPGPVFPPAGLEHLKMAKTLSTLPLARPVDAKDLADAVYMLASNRSVTGSVLNVDCGQGLL